MKVKIQHNQLQELNPNIEKYMAWNQSQEVQTRSHIFPANKECHYTPQEMIHERQTHQLWIDHFWRFCVEDKFIESYPPDQNPLEI